MSVARLAFMGTPDFAVAALAALCDDPRVEVVVVYTQPDRPAGRGRRLLPSPVKAFAQQRQIPCRAPTRLRGPEAVAEFAAWRLDLSVVAAYGRLLPPTWLSTPRLGCVNIHASLLPQFRGASPIAHALLAGESHTGVSLMQMDAGMDTGAVLTRRDLRIAADDTCATLTARLAALGASALQEILAPLLAGELRPVAQSNLLPLPHQGRLPAPSHAPMLRKQDAELDFARPAVALERQIRAFDPWPRTAVVCGERRLGVLRARAAATPLASDEGSPPAPPGTVLQAGAAGIEVACGEGSLWLLEVQPQNRRRMPAAAWLSGHPLRPGERLHEAI